MFPASYMIANYPVSADYKQLASLARECSVICIVDYENVGGEPIRDVASTSHSQHSDDEVFQVRARGISYIYAFSEDEFITQCQQRNVAFVVPESVKNGESETLAPISATEQPAQTVGDAGASGCRLPVVHIGRTLDELDAKVWPFIEEKAKGVGPVHGRIETYGYERGNGGVVVLWDGETIHAMAATVRDGLNRTVCVCMSADDSLDAMRLAPRDVLMAFGREVLAAASNECQRAFGLMETFEAINLAAIADRYVGQVQSGLAEQQAELDIALFAKTIGDFEACEETDTPHETLLQFARAGWLHCVEFEVSEDDALKGVRFQITNAGRAVLVPAQEQKEGSA